MVGQTVLYTQVLSDLLLYTDVSNALAPASTVLIQTCESDTN